jgi:hypothetical protein
VASLPPPQSLPSARTLLVAVHDWFYTFDVLEDDQNPITPALLESVLHEIVADVSERIKAQEIAVPISVLSADDRDTWAKVCTA